MILGRVIGNAVSTVKHPAYEGHTVLLVRPVKADGKTPNGHVFLASDAVQAGEGDLVLCAREGNAARQILGSSEDPFHAVVLGIVDQVDGPGGFVQGPGPEHG
jgi:microcompartment protein CcmK/EutM